MTQEKAFEITRVLDAPVEKVWKAISDKNEMKNWYFDLAAFEAKPGFKFQFYGGTPEKQYLHQCEVKEAIPNKKLSYSWRYDGYEGDSLVTFELSAEGDKTKLTLTHSGLETFPPIADFARKNFEAGWTEIIGTSLPDYLKK